MSNENCFCHINGVRVKDTIAREQLNEISQTVNNIEKGVTFTPNLDANGNLSWSNNGGLDNPKTVNIKGPKGNTGNKGTNGTNGVTYTPYFDTNGFLAWTNDGGLANPAPHNIKGRDGARGEDGISSYMYVDFEIYVKGQYNYVRVFAPFLGSNGNVSTVPLRATIFDLCDCFPLIAVATENVGATPTCWLFKLVRDPRGQCIQAYNFHDNWWSNAIIRQINGVSHANGYYPYNQQLEAGDVVVLDLQVS